MLRGLAVVHRSDQVGARDVGSLREEDEPTPRGFIVRELARLHQRPEVRQGAVAANLWTARQQHAQQGFHALGRVRASVEGSGRGDGASPTAHESARGVHPAAPSQDRQPLRHSHARGVDHVYRQAQVGARHTEALFLQTIEADVGQGFPGLAIFRARQRKNQGAVDSYLPRDRDPSAWARALEEDGARICAESGR